MKLQCEKEILSEAVGTVMKAASPKSSIPILEGIYLRAENGTLTMIGTDLEISVETTIPVSVQENGKFVLEAKRFFDMIRKLPNDIITLDIRDDMNTTLSSQKAFYKTMALSAEEFPAVQEVRDTRSFSLSSLLLKSMIRETKFAVSQNESSRPVLTGALFDVKEQTIRVVALDGFRLAIRKEAVETSETFRFIVPGKTLNELLNILPDTDETVDIFFNQKHALFQIGTTKIITRLIEGEFFDYERSIPTDCRLSILMDTSLIKACIERAEPIISASDFQKNPIKINIEDDSFSIDCRTNAGIINDVLQIAPVSEPLEIGFNHKYLQDAVRACNSSEIKMEFSSSNSPCLLKPAEGDSFLYMVLPVRLKA